MEEAAKKLVEQEIKIALLQKQSEHYKECWIEAVDMLIQSIHKFKSQYIVVGMVDEAGELSLNTKLNPGVLLLTTTPHKELENGKKRTD